MWVIACPLPTLLNIKSDPDGQRQHDAVTCCFTDSGQHQEQREWDSHQAGNKGECVADDRCPGEQQGPDPVTEEPRLCPVDVFAAITNYFEEQTKLLSSFRELALKKKS